MSHDQAETDWTPSLLCWVVFTLSLVFLIGWLLTAGLVVNFAGAVDWLPLWLLVPVGLGSPMAGGALAAVLCWRYCRRAVLRVASFPGKVVSEGLGCFLVVCLGATGIGIIPMAFGLREFQHHRWLGSFRPAEATVTGTRIDEVEFLGHKGLAPRVLYEFRAGDERYTGYKIHWDLRWYDPSEAGGGPPPPDVAVWSRDPSARESLTGLLRRYPTGKAVTAYYDPADPANACLVYVPFEPTLHGMGLWFALGFALIFWTIFVIAWAVGRRSACGDRSSSSS